MDLWRPALAIVTAAVVFLNEFSCSFGDVVTLDVKHKFAGQPRNLTAMKAHDLRRHGRLLSTVDIDIPLGGDGYPTGAGLYFAKLLIGNPIEEYHVQVDTGSDLLWLNCAGCDKCPKESNLGIELKLYDPKKSSSSSLVYCKDEFCSTAHDGKLKNCKSERQCEYYVVYGDGTGNGGYFVKDSVQLQQVTGNLQTAPTNGTIVFGCGNKRSGDLSTSSEAVNGIIGFGQANSSVISQLAASGKVKKKFAHCLDNVDGGGIFTIGEVVEPQIKNKAPMLPKQSHYKIKTKEVEIGDTIIKLATSFFGRTDENAAIIDSGTTLSYLPTRIYELLVEKITSGKQFEVEKIEGQFSCFKYENNVDDEFPVVKFHFKNSLVLSVYPHDYLFKYRDDMRCIGWQDNGSKKDEEDLILLGDLALSNKLVIYDIENQSIGWTDYNCTTNVKVKDAQTGTEYTVGAHLISSATSFTVEGILILLPILTHLLHFSL
ncbi:hypothetical protein like AT3G02740 [Hibiscus trionum]|uniref:Peptidase A1 domain-containing protein n=1 Tax=Hibiscus trionum TaxID=183268 RepID=A0A9W7IDC2_HIBTR|nr:hypothetical protein like AT3G02740 [Hibiscus trionum]